MTHPGQKNSRIAKKLIVYVVLFSSFITLFTTGFQLYREYDQDLDAIKQVFQQIEESYLESIVENVWLVDQRRLQILLDGIRRLPDFQFAEVNVDNKLFASSGTPPDNGAMVETYDLMFDHRGNKLKIGRLTIAADLNALYERTLERIWVILVSNGIKTFLVSIFIYFIVLFMITRHLSALTVYAKGITVDRLTSPFRLKRPVNLKRKPDELDDLTSSINEMQAHLHEYYGELKSLNESLEERVKERTSELAREITEHKRTEGALRESEGRLRHLFETVGSLIMVVSSDGILTAFNREAERVFGVPGEAVVGRPYEEVFQGDAFGKIFAGVVEKAMSGTATADFEHAVRPPNGRERYVVWNVSRVTDRSGGIESIIVSGQDISDRHLAEEELRQQEERFRLVLDNALVGIITIDDKGRIQSVNSAAEKIFGYREDEIIDENVNILMPEPYRSHHDGYLEAYQRTGQAKIIGYGREVEGMRKNGEVFPLALAVSTLRLGKKSLFTGIVRDITERKQVERDILVAKQQAESASKTKSEFLASMSHELRTPLNAIIGFSEAMEEEIFGKLGNDKYKEYIHDINRSGSHLLDLINDILDVSAIEAGKVELHEDTLDVAAVVDASVRLVMPRASRRQINLVIDPCDTLPGLRADERRLKQILLNLLTNAVKFTPEEKAVRLSVEVDKKGVMRFDIADEGIGMDEDEIAKAMTPFGQVDSSLTRKYEGTGLGLPLTKALIDLHAGNLEINSKKGVGTTVSVRFPAKRVMQT